MVFEIETGFVLRTSKYHLIVILLECIFHTEQCKRMGIKIKGLLTAFDEQFISSCHICRNLDNSNLYIENETQT